jgi:hypothetical protein
MTPAIDTVKMAELVALVDPSAAPEPAMEFPPSLKKENLRLGSSPETRKCVTLPTG